MDTVGTPTLNDVAAELRESGADARASVEKLEDAPMPCLQLGVHFAGQQDFQYRIYPVEHDLPSFAYRAQTEVAQYFRLEVFTATGSHGYDVYGYTAEALAADVLGHFESHLEYLRLSASDADASASTIEEPGVADWTEDLTGEH